MLGITTEDQVKKLEPADLLKCDKLSFEDIMLVNELQFSVKSNKVYSFLAQNDE